MVKIVLLALNSSFIHTNLAVRSIKDSLINAGYGAEILEFNLKDRRGTILSSLYREEADIYGFSSYIWNIGEMLSLADDLKKLRPECTIVFGGPEVSYNAEELLAKHSFIDHIITGEGENAFIWLAEAAGKNKLPAFDDADQVEEGMAPVFGWALNLGLVKPLTETTLGPNELATRGQLAELTLALVTMLDGME